MAVSISKDLIVSEVQLVKLEIRKEKHLHSQQPTNYKHSNRIVNQKIIGYQDNLQNPSYKNQLLILLILWDNLWESLAKGQKTRKFFHQAVVLQKENDYRSMKKIKTDQLFVRVALIQNSKINQRSLTTPETLAKMNIAKVTLWVSNHPLKSINQSRASLVRLHHLQSTMNKFYRKINSNSSFKVATTHRACPSLISSLYPINNSLWILLSNNSLCKGSNLTSHHQLIFHSLQTNKLSTCWAKTNS